MSKRRNYTPHGKRLLIAGIVFAAATLFLFPYLGWLHAPLIGWDLAALMLLVRWYIDLHGKSALETAEIAADDDINNPVAESIILLASIASIVGIGALMVRKIMPFPEPISIGISLLSVFISWNIVHMIFTLRYAVMYYTSDKKGISFDDTPISEEPRFTDFMYLAYTVGMCYQVSDIQLESSHFRKVVLKHALISFLFGVIILGTMINFIASLLA